MLFDHSLFCSGTKKDKPLLEPATCTSGTRKIKHRGNGDWDFFLDVSHGRKPIDLSLILPHYRARHQPVDHRMSMFISSTAKSPTRLKVCRAGISSSWFYLKLRASSFDVTLWLPSDFKGQIHHTGKANFSAGFMNKIMRNVSFNDSLFFDQCAKDVVVVDTTGHVTFRMWDVWTRSPEIPHKEAMRRMFGRNRRKVSETSINWDFLLED